MTPDDPRPSPPDDTGTDALASRDELASALVDGVLSTEEAAEARSRPDVAARAAAIESSRAALQAVPPADSAARERAIAAALVAFDEAAADGEPAGATTPSPAPGDHLAARPGDARAHHPATDAADAAAQVHRHTDSTDTTRPGDAPARLHHGSDATDTTPPGDTPARLHAVPGASDGGRATSRRPLPRWLGAAAAVAALAGAAGLAVVNSGGSDDESSDMAVSAPDEAAEESTADAAGGAGADDTRSSADAPPAGTGDSAQSGLVPPDVGDLGTFASEDDLAAQIESLLVDSPLAAESAPSSSADDIAPSSDAFADRDASCPGGLPAALADGSGEVRLQGRAVVEGRHLDLWVVGSGGGDRLVALDVACAVVIDRSLP